jgi:hypothetical protein
MVRVFILSFTLLFYYTNVGAQAKLMNGYLRDSITHFPIIGGTVTNASRGKRATSNVKGFFRIEASPNNTLYTVANGYRFDTLTYSPLFADTVILYLSPTGAVLPNVTVTAPYNKYQLDSIERKRAFEQNRGPVMPTIAASPSSGFGLTINLDRFFKKKYKEQKRQEHTFRKSEEAAYRQYRFPPELVAYYTGLKVEELRTFMFRYMPSYEWLRQHPSNELVMYYLNEKIKDYRADHRQ